LVKVRPFDLDDVEYVANQQRLLNQYHQSFDGAFYAPAEDAFAEFSGYISGRLKDSEFVIFIAEQSMQKLGYAMGWIEIRPPIYQHRKIGYLSNIFVSEEHRHLGVGKHLFYAMEEWFRAREADFIEIRSDARNAKTLHTFKNVGFKELSITFYKTILKSLP
jgi:ribosomal protein S18 acetylase RimI-like enzyme